jgi:glutaredoxin-like protein
MSQMLDDGIINQLNNLFLDLQMPVDILYFGSQTQNCQYCTETQQLLDEVTSLTEKITLHVHDFDDDKELATQYSIERVPAFVIAGHDENGLVDHGIRFFGIPSGHEFTSLITDLLMVSKGDSGLSDEGRAFLSALKTPVHLQVYVTPT